MTLYRKNIKPIKPVIHVLNGKQQFRGKAHIVLLSDAGGDTCSLAAVRSAK